MHSESRSTPKTYDLKKKHSLFSLHKILWWSIRFCCNTCWSNAMISDPNPSVGYVFRSGSWTQKSSSCCDQGLAYHLLHIHTCQGLEQTTEPTSSSLCWEPQHEIWMVVDLKSWVFPMKSEHMTHIVDIVAHRVGSQLAREDHVVHLQFSCWFPKS